QHDEGLATYFAKAALAAAAPRLAARRDQVLGSWRRLSPLPEPGQRRPDELAFLYSCDANFFRIYFPYWLSVAEYLKPSGFHFHFLLNGQETEILELLSDAEALRQRLGRFRDCDPDIYADNISYSFAPLPEFCAKPVTYFACARYLFARTVSQAFGGRLIIQDIDLVFRDNPRSYFETFAQDKFAIWCSAGLYGLDPWRRFIAITFPVPCSEQAHECLADLEDYILAGLEKAGSWYLDQNALLYFFERMVARGRADMMENLARRPRPTFQERINSIFEYEQIEKRRRRSLEQQAGRA
ncbi:MAG: hypothetical protein JO267_03840, partial [Alphaproteobacteria bacterium]|nr:hypothetical protein [Alphaproteobacteria bacterium]